MRLDAEKLPKPLKEPPYQEAARTLEMLTQDELERERYEAREKALKDAAMWKKARERLAQLEKLEKELAAEKRYALKNRKEGEAEGLARGQLIGQIRLCEQILKRKRLAEKKLQALSLEELQHLADQLKQEALG